MSETTRENPKKHADSALAPINEIHEQRIVDYQRQVLSDPDAMAASLGALNCQLIRIACHMARATEERSGQSPM